MPDTSRNLKSPPFRLRANAGSVWPPLPTPKASQVWAMYLELCRTQWLSREEIESSQLAQIRGLLAHVIRHVPYYRSLLVAAGIVPEAILTMADFGRIPILERRTYQEHFPEMAAEVLPAGIQQLGKLRTSGTSGMPIDVLQTNVSQLWWLAYTLRDIEWCGVDSRGSIAVIRSTRRTGDDMRQLLEGVRQPRWSDQLAGVIETGPSYVMDVHQDPRVQLDWLRRVGPDCLLSYPSNLEFLAAMAIEQGLRIPNLRVIQTISETLTLESRQKIEQAFGVPVKTTYSCCEAGYVASPCPQGHGLHVHAENVILEVLDASGNPCRPGETGRVVLTSLQNHASPFIRYEILDEAEVGQEQCACGRGLPLLNRVQGKRRPLLALPDGRKKCSSDLADGFRKLGGLYQFQVIQRAPDHVTTRLVPNQHWTNEHRTQVTRMMHEFFESAVRVDFETCERIPLTEGGKMLDFVIELDSDMPVTPSR